VKGRLVKYYYKTDTNVFDNVICVEKCSLYPPINIGSENCTRCQKFYSSGFDKIHTKGWVKCKEIDKATKKMETDYSQEANQIGCGYCAKEDKCKIKDSKVNKAMQGCKDFKHWKDETLDETTALCFVTQFDKEKVHCYFFKLEQLREFDMQPFFYGMKLYKGKNIVFTTKVTSGSMITNCTQKTTKKIVQLWNYYIRGEFKLK